MTASEYFEQGRKMLDEGNLMLAMEFFQAAIEVDKHFDKAFLLLFEVYKKQGKPEKAKATLFSLLAIDASNTSALEKLTEELYGATTVGVQQNAIASGLLSQSQSITSIQTSTKSLSGAASINLPVYNGMIIDMVFVEGGSFLYGAQSDNVFEPNYDPKALFRERACEKSVGDFFIGKYLVTQNLWIEVMGNNPAACQRGGDYPIENVSSSDISVFIDRLNQGTGRSFRLPTDVEWEYAARGGKLSNGFKYPGSDNLREVAWTSFDSFLTREVGRKKPNELGLYDMLGNVCELCKGDTFLSSSPGLMVPGLVIRGGADRKMWDWYNTGKGQGGKLERINLCRISAWTRAPLNADQFIGFRLAMDKD